MNMGKLDRSSNTISRRDFLSLGIRTAVLSAASTIPGLLQVAPVGASSVENMTETYLGISIEGPANFVADMKAALDLLASSYYNTPESWAANIGVTSYIRYEPNAEQTYADTTKSFLGDTSMSPNASIWRINMNRIAFEIYPDPGYLRTVWLAAVLAHEAKHLSLNKRELVVSGVESGMWHTDCWSGPHGEIPAYEEGLDVLKVLGGTREMQEIMLEPYYHFQYLVSQNPNTAAYQFCAAEEG